MGEGGSVTLVVENPPKLRAPDGHATADRVTRVPSPLVEAINLPISSVGWSPLSGSVLLSYWQ